MRILPALVVIVGALSLADSTFAQRKPAARKSAPAKTSSVSREPQAPPTPVLPDIRDDPDVEAADVAIIANITAKELRFDAVPNPTVDFLGKDKTQTIWHTDRFNLPDKVEPGVTYRNVGIRLKITSRLADIDRIVAEALGEVPTESQASAASPPAVSSAPSAKKVSPSDLKVKSVPHD